MYKTEVNKGKKHTAHKPSVFTKYWSSNHGCVVIDNTAIYLVIVLGHTSHKVINMCYVICFKSINDSMK